MKKQNIFVAGSGSWGLAMAKLLSENGHAVTICCHSEEKADSLRVSRENPALLPGVRLPEQVLVTAAPEAARDAALAVIAVPSFAVAGICAGLKPWLRPGTVVVLLSKGFDVAHENCLLSQTAERELPGLPVVALTGPSHAEEVSRGIPTAVLAASRTESAASLVQETMGTETFRIYTSPDIISAELGGAMKNIMALAVGISDGYGFGDNTKAMLMTRGIAEMSRLGVFLGGKAETFAGLSGVGDLIVTCISCHSRNRRAGLLIGGGMPVAEALREVGAVVEGYYATQAIQLLTRGKPIELPICNAMYQLLYEGLPMGHMVSILLNRANRPEHEAHWEQ